MKQFGRASSRSYISRRTRPPSLKLATLLVAALLAVAHGSATALITKQVGPTRTYTTIQAAVSSITPSMIPLTDSISIDVDPGTYREKVTVNGKDGTASHRLTIRGLGTSGQVILDGTDPFVATWYQHGVNQYVYYAYNDTLQLQDPQSQLFVNDALFIYADKPNLDFHTIAEGEWTIDYEAAGDTVIYIHAGGPSPGSLSLRLGDRRRTAGFDVIDTDYLTIENFKVMRTADKGITVTGTGHWGVPILRTSGYDRLSGVMG